MMLFEGVYFLIWLLIKNIVHFSDCCNCRLAELGWTFIGKRQCYCVGVTTSDCLELVVNAPFLFAVHWCFRVDHEGRPGSVPLQCFACQQCNSRVAWLHFCELKFKKFRFCVGDQFYMKMDGFYCEDDFKLLS
uniref:Secreted protein n=1 Tax=Ditylenchus dipsaci TaxID=166011 RepID=A0A915E3A8_9BILA